jgi:hypothetical protein
MSVQSNWSGYHNRSYAYAGNGVAFTCIETSDQPLAQPPSVPGITAEPAEALPVERPAEEKAAAILQARITKAERAERAQEAIKARAARQAERRAWALQQATERRALPASQPPMRLPWE